MGWLEQFLSIQDKVLKFGVHFSSVKQFKMTSALTSPCNFYLVASDDPAGGVMFQHYCEYITAQFENQ